MTEAQWLLEGRAAPSGLKRPLWPQGHLVSGGRVHWGWDLVSKASRSETPLWETSSEGVEGPAMIETGPQDWRGWESRARVTARVRAPSTSRLAGSQF